MAGIRGTEEARPSRELTKWEIYQRESIHLLLQNSMKNKVYFEEKDKSLRVAAGAGAAPTSSRNDDWMKFRQTMFDLYSVLDYTYFLLYCHFSNGGEQENSHNKASECGFPYKYKGVKICETSKEQDKQDKFKKDNTDFLFSGKLREGTHFCSIVDEILLVQPKLHVYPNGEKIRREIPEGDGESLALLHYLRNCSTHRSLIQFEPKQMCVEFNHSTKEQKLVPIEKKSKNEDLYYYSDLGKGYFIQLLDGGPLTTENNCYNLLIVVLDRLVKFVQKFASKLLSTALLLDTYELPGNPSVNLTRCVNAFPQVEIKWPDSYNILKYNFQQAMKSKLKLDVNHELPVDQGDRNQYFKCTYTLTVKQNGKDLIKLCSKEYNTKGKDAAKNAAVEEVMKECIHLGIIKIV